MPFNKNNPRQEEAAKQAETGSAPLTEKQKRIADLKKSLLAPLEKKGIAGRGAIAKPKESTDI